LKNIQAKNIQAKKIEEYSSQDSFDVAGNLEVREVRLDRNELPSSNQPTCRKYLIHIEF
jgi:hypothetical protein